MQHDIVMVGCGNMGLAMLRRLLENTPHNFYVVKPTKLPDDLLERVFWASNVTKLPHDLQPKMVILAVKPQIMQQVLQGLRGIFGANTLFCSMAAGLNTQFYHDILGQVPIIRMMPNTPVAIGEGVVALYGAHEKTFINQLFASLGRLIWLEDEHLIDVATAISGSGSAYVYLFIGALADAASSLGIPHEVARQMAQQTLLGAAKMATQNPDKSLQQLQAEVTSKGGTTEAALQQLQKNDALKQLVFQAVEAALVRASELNAENTIT